ncbi:MAG: UvrD-helicase domain-containing protein [Muribaculaceae bacterium]|nr:UvrD-helicase domain-containing protein [Muribaculaceae bacterium]
MLTIYKASAGSGKTFQLTLHYIKNLLGTKTEDESSPDGTRWILNPAFKGGHPYNHRQILAITFTNKATEEMKSRIITSLDQIAKGKHEKYIDSLTKEFKCDAADLSHAAEQALTSLLLDYKFFNVSTIDSFFQSILRSFAYELDVQGDYEVELGEETSIKDGLNDLLERVNYRRITRGSRYKASGGEDRILGKLDSWFKSLIRKQFTEEKKASNPFQRDMSVYSTLVKQVSQIFKEDFKSREDQMRRYLIDREGALERFSSALTTKLEQIEEAAPKIANRINDALMRHGYSLENLNGNSYRQQIKGLLEKPPKWPKMDTLSMTAIINGEKEPYEVVTKPPKSLINSVEDQAVILESFKEISELKKNRDLLQKISEGLIYLELTGYMLRSMSSVNDEKNRIVLGDTNRLIHQIIKGTDTPFIYERIGVYLKNFLIDEFQDTSRMQWQNLLPLVRNSLANNDDSLIIGDTKQAIYRFRNSDSSMLGHTLVNRDFENYDALDIHGTEGAENTNYRTSATIVRFNNTFFPAFAEALDQKAGYEGGEVIQMSPTEKEPDRYPGYVRLVPYTKSGEFTTEDCDADIIGSIKDAIQRGYKYKDIAILVRRNNDPQDLIDGMIKAGIPVQSQDSLFVRSAPSIKMLVCLLYSFERIEGSRRGGAAEKRRISYNDTLYIMSRIEYLIAKNPRMTMGEAIDEAVDLFDNDDSEGSRTVLSEISKSHPSSLVAVVESIIAAGLIPDEFLKSEKDYIAAFVDFVTEYTENQDDDLRSFLRHWENNKKKLSLPPPPTANAVAVMTVHQAKGLEWPIVFIPKFEWSFTPPATETKWVTTKAEYNESTGVTEPAEFDLSTLGLDINDEDIPPLLKIQISSSIINLHPGLKELGTRILSMQTVDILNLVYVAFTRPKSELHVYYLNETGKRQTGMVMKDTLERIASAGNEESGDTLTTVFDENVYNPETGELTIGEPTTPVEANEESPAGSGVKSEEVTVDKYYSTYRPDTAIIVKVGSIDLEDLDDEIEDDEVDEHTEVVSERMEEAARRGISLHSILEKVINRGDLDKVLESIAFTDAEEAAEAREILSKAFSNATVRDWFGDSPSVSEVRTEVSIFVPNPLDVLDNGDISRIDRLVFHRDGSIEVVDYKFTTGRKKGDRDQVKRYIGLMRQIYPDRKISGSLWYVDQNVIVAVND